MTRDASTTTPTLDFDGLRPPSPWLTDAHLHWRQRVRAFVTQEIEPHLDDWEASGTFPDSVYETAAHAGMLGVGFPTQLGGHTEDADPYYRMLFAEELHRPGSGVVFADLATHWIALPPVVQFGAPELRESVVRPVLAGARKMAFAVTEPGGGSDAGALQTCAERHGQEWLVNGTKTLISGALRADFVLTAVRTGGPGAGGISLLLVDAASPGLDRYVVPGLRWYNSSIGTLEFHDVRVPLDRLIGPENRGFAALARQFNVERLSGIAATLAMSRTAVAEAIAWAQQREAFGHRLVEHQAVRHKLVDLVRAIRVAYAFLDQCVWRLQRGETVVADIAMLKVQATRTLERCARESMHVLGGRAYSGPTRLERIYREARIFALGGGTEEILDDLAARQLGLL
ncbi:MAG TPA: acyl-CoA dehydrogenase family protein [Steroidobacteraceae bacterium]|jgi:acyl-CoA dehydrogenase|nr:acyl-CoA dehydrogenase family protein [Steroidobacteraceae bacterium]